MRTFFAFLLIMVAAILPAAAQDQDSPPFFQPYDDLLQTHVNNGIVSYSGWAQDPRHKAAMAMLTASHPENQKTLNQKLAFWINAYNLLTIDLIVREEEHKSIKNLGSIFSSPWELHKWDVGSQSYTLDDIEHKILRPLGQPLIHMALNCASMSCPPLYERAYRSEILDNQLQVQAIRFVRDEERGVRRKGPDKVAVSMIFKWFQDDFGGIDGVRRFIALYRSEDDLPFIESYLNYDWSLNGTWE